MKIIINTQNAPASIGPYSQAVRAGDFLFISGQIPVDPNTDKLISDTLKEETLWVLDNVSAILTEAGFAFSDLVKTTIFLSDMSHFAEVNEIYGSYFSADFPARETVAVKGLPKGVNVEISAIAYKRDEQ